MIKRILIPLDTSPYAEAALELGCNVAKRHGAEITGLVVLDIPGIERSIGPLPIGGLYYVEPLEKAMEKEARAQVQLLLNKFKEKCQKEGVAHQEAEHQGSPSERIIRESIFYDFVIVGLRTYFHFRAVDKPGDSLEKILDHSITPIYGVPEKFSMPTAEKIKVLIAFNGSLPSARAMQRFAQLAVPETTEVTLLMSDPKRETADYYLAQAEAYLNSHFICNIKKEWTSKDIIQAMEEQYLDWATIIVVGAHSKKRLIDFNVGSLTRYLINDARKPIIIGQ